MVKLSCEYRRWRLIPWGMLLLLSVAWWLPLVASAQSLSVTPQRVILEGRVRSSEVKLINRGNEETSFRVYFAEKRMKEDGSYEKLKKPGKDDLYASRLVRYSPRSATIGPNSVQTVRLLIRKPQNLPAGEYRSHLVIESVPKASSGADIEKEALKEGQIRIQMIQRFAISIPVVVRHGNISATATLADLKFTQGVSDEAVPVLGLRINREGKRSITGDLEITYKAVNEKAVEVGRVLRTTVLNPTKSRVYKIKLQPPQGVEFQGGLLRVIYRARPEEGGAVLARGELVIP